MSHDCPNYCLGLGSLLPFSPKRVTLDVFPLLLSGHSDVPWVRASCGSPVCLRYDHPLEGVGLYRVDLWTSCNWLRIYAISCDTSPCLKLPVYVHELQHSL